MRGAGPPSFSRAGYPLVATPPSAGTVPPPADDSVDSTPVTSAAGVSLTPRAHASRDPLPVAENLNACAPSVSGGLPPSGRQPGTLTSSTADELHREWSQLLWATDPPPAVAVMPQVNAGFYAAEFHVQVHCPVVLQRSVQRRNQVHRITTRRTERHLRAVEFSCVREETLYRRNAQLN